MVSAIANTLKSDLCNIFSFEGNLLQDVKYLHPFIKNRECPLFPAQHVTMAKGTGLVHTAPNHGFDDYTVAKKHAMSLDVCLVDESGCYTRDAGENLANKDVLNLGSQSIIELMHKDILCIEDYVHSYPYDWRSKTPVLIRSSHQWFIDVQGIQEQAMNCLRDVTLIPDHLKKAFLNQLVSAPPWCISRQRSWGVAIPAFYTEGKSVAIVDRILTDNLCSLIKKYGIHCWWEMDVDKLLPPELKNKLNLKNVDCVKGLDILDIWLDSGISWKSVLPEPCISDVCIEGVDQIRGWFNSSLLTSVALRGIAPYRTLFLHGFTTDADGRKMSKSEGNVISPSDILEGSQDGTIPPYGIDVLRWWVASHACQHENIPVKLKIMDECSQNLNKIRNTYKFLLGSLQTFNPLQDLVAPKEMRALDIYMLYQLLHFSEKVWKEYNDFHYKNVSKDILNFVTNEVSSYYCHLIKDRLYCAFQYSIDRLSCQTVLYFILNILVQSIGPVCPHLAEEVMLHHPVEDIAKLGLFRCDLPCLNTFMKNVPLPTSMILANQIRDHILKAEVKPNAMELLILCDNEISHNLQNLNDNVADSSGLTEFFQVSEVAFSDQTNQSFPGDSIILNGNVCGTTKDSHPFTLMFSKSNLKKCPRCWRYSAATSSVLCNRCLHIVKEAKEQKCL